MSATDRIREVLQKRFDEGFENEDTSPLCAHCTDKWADNVAKVVAEALQLTQEWGREEEDTTGLGAPPYVTICTEGTARFGVRFRNRKGYRDKVVRRWVSKWEADK